MLHFSKEELAAAKAGDDWRRPLEVVAAERRILTYADALLTWMRDNLTETVNDPKIDGFFTHEMPNPLSRPAWQHDPDLYVGHTKHLVLDKLDPDANRLMLDMLRACWERRCWEQRYGMRQRLD